MGQGGWLIFLDQQKWLFVFGKNSQMFPEDKPIKPFPSPIQSITEELNMGSIKLQPKVEKENEK